VDRAACDNLLQRGSCAVDADTIVVDPDAVDHRLEVGLPEGDRAGCDILPHCPTEPLDSGGVDRIVWLEVRLRAFERGLIRITPQGRRSVAEDDSIR